RGGRCRVVQLAARPPLAARIVAGPPGGPEPVLVGSAAALLEGDAVSVAGTLRPRARPPVRTTAATRAHPCPGRRPPGHACPAPRSPAVLGGLRHTGSVPLLGLRPAHRVPGVLDLAGPGATARAVAPGAASLERLLAPARARFLERLPGPSPFPEPKETFLH